MSRRFTDRQVTIIGVIIGLLVTLTIAGLWLTVKHIREKKDHEQYVRDSLREVNRQRVAAEYAAEKALEDSVEDYNRTHSARAIAERMQVILAGELQHKGQKPYYTRYRTEGFRELIEEVAQYERDSVRRGGSFYNIPFYKYLPKRDIVDCEITRVYYVTERTALVDVRYLLRNDSIPSKTAIYYLQYDDDEWWVDDCVINQESERRSLKWYMEGLYFMEQRDSVQIDSIHPGRNDYYIPREIVDSMKKEREAERREAERRRAEEKKNAEKEKSKASADKPKDKPKATSDKPKDKPKATSDKQKDKPKNTSDKSKTSSDKSKDKQKATSDKQKSATPKKSDKK
ncbi:MAG: hypothetical protein II562_01645 [Prevotella sp.]|nr:hypothetical protein [Prevotella sp.]